MPPRLFARTPKVTQRRPALVASGKQLSTTASSSSMRRPGVPEWQQTAWSYYDQIGEIRYAARYSGNSLSRLRMYLGWRTTPSSPVVPLDTDELPAGVDRRQLQIAEDTIGRLYDTDGSLSGLLRQYGVNLFVAGESYLVGRNDANNGRERWEILSVDQVVYHDGRWKLRMDVSDTPDRYETLLDDDVVVRLWNPHPRFAKQADSPMRAVLPLCEELLLLSASVRASALSRMSAGVLVLPDTALEGGPFGDDADNSSGFDGESGSDPVLQDMMDHFIEPISDASSAAAVAPYILAMDPADCDKVKLLDTSRSVDETAAAQRAELLVRIANGVDLPPEVLQGMSNTNHWNAWLIDEQSYKAHIAPSAQLFADSITEGLIWPAIESVTGGAVDQRLVIGFDPVDLVGHADQRNAAKDGHSALVLSDEALRRSLGFSDDDAPDEAEYIRRVALRNGAISLAPVAAGESDSIIETIARVSDARIPQTQGGPPPEDIVDGGELPDEAADEGDEDVDAGPPQRDGLTAASSPTNLGQRLAQIDRALFDRLQITAELTVQRALERAGARVRSKLSRQADWRETLKVTANADLPSVVGQQYLADIEITDDELLAGSFTEIAAEFDVRVARAQGRARRLLAEEFGYDDSEQLEDKQDENRAAALFLFLSGLTAVTVARLYPGRPDRGVDAPVVDRQALRTDDVLPASVTRGALAVAGGGEAPRGPEPSRGGRQPDGLVATGPDVVAAAAEVGLVEAGFIWSYGDEERQVPFEPHLALDGRSFSGWDDENLLNGEPWPPVEYYFPGDHEYCRCSAVPVFRAVALIDGEEVE